MASKLLAFRLPEELVEAIDSQAKATGRDRTAVVVHALKQIFGLPSTEPTKAKDIQEQLKGIEKKVSSLSEQLTDLRQETRLNSSIIQQLKELDDKIIRKF